MEIQISERAKKYILSKAGDIYIENKIVCS